MTKQDDILLLKGEGISVFIRLEDSDRIVRISEDETEGFIKELVDGKWVDPVSPVSFDSVWNGREISEADLPTNTYCIDG